MRRAAFAAILLLTLSCARPAVVPGYGAVGIQIIPNPIIATKVSGDTYDFPFEVVVRETGGHPIEVDRVSADVYALGGVRIATESYGAARIRSLGYSLSVPANGELRYRFAPRRAVADDRLFSAVSADLRVDAHDETGATTTASTTVTVRR